MNYIIEYTWNAAAKRRETTPLWIKALAVTAGIVAAGVGVRYHFPAEIARLQAAFMPGQQALKAVFYDMTRLAQAVEVFCQELLHGA